MAAKFVLEKDAAGRFRFRLMSQGRVLANSETYTTKRAAQNAIASIRTTAPAAQIDDGTQAGPTTAKRAPAKRAAKRAPATGEATTAKAAKTVRAAKTVKAAKAVKAAKTTRTAKAAKK